MLQVDEDERKKNDPSWRLPALKWAEVREKLAFLAGEDINSRTDRVCACADRAMWTDDVSRGGRYISRR